jgi:hypothetical protein
MALYTSRSPLPPGLAVAAADDLRDKTPSGVELLVAHGPQIGFVDQSVRVEGVVGPFGGRDNSPPLA